MSKPSLAESPSKSQLNPVLKVVLHNLDIQLQDELKRYRRKRAGKPLASDRGIGRNQTPEPIELISLPTIPTVEAEPSPVGDAQRKYIAIAPEKREPETNKEDTEFNQESHPFPTITPFPYPHPPAPDNYLESSERLVKSLDEETTSPNKSNSRFQDQMMNPLGIGSILLLLLACITFGYVIWQNRTSLTIANLRRIINPTATEVSQTSKPNRNGISNGSKLPPIPNTPNLASQEFVELDLNTIGMLNPNKPQNQVIVPNPSKLAQQLPQTAASPTTKPTTAAPPLNLTAALLPSPPAVHQSSTVENASDQKKSSTAIQLEDKYYYVLSEYLGDESLQKARKIVSDAYLRDFPQGTRIQLGAYKDQTTANLIAEQLRKQGIEVQVYKP